MERGTIAGDSFVRDSRDEVDQIVTLAMRIMARLVAGRGGPSHYASSGPLPVGTKKRQFNERCPSIPEARKSGRDWVIACDAWHAALAKPAPRKPRLVEAPAVNDSAEEILRASGMQLRKAGGQ